MKKIVEFFVNPFPKWQWEDLLSQLFIQVPLLPMSK
jgi:hypothetical protein